jgi:hypothetical protein
MPLAFKGWSGWAAEAADGITRRPTSDVSNSRLRETKDLIPDLRSGAESNAAEA